MGLNTSEVLNYLRADDDEEGYVEVVWRGRVRQNQVALIVLSVVDGGVC